MIADVSTRRQTMMRFRVDAKVSIWFFLIGYEVNIIQLAREKKLTRIIFRLTSSSEVYKV
jgi:hypothetical protein